MNATCNIDCKGMVLKVPKIRKMEYWPKRLVVKIEFACEVTILKVLKYWPKRLVVKTNDLCTISHMFKSPSSICIIHRNFCITICLILHQFLYNIVFRT